MKRFVVSTLAAACSLLLTATAHASFVEKNFRSEPEWKTQDEVNEENDTRIDARTAVPADEAEMHQTEEEVNFNTVDPPRLPASGSVTRAEFTALLVRSMYVKESIDSCYWDITSVWPPRFELLFRDVAVDHPYAPEICVAMRDGLVRGYGNDIFRPEATITFADAAKILSRSNGLTPWADPSNPKHWFDIYVSAMARRNAIPMSITAIDQRLTMTEAMEMISRLTSDDRTQPSRTADELIAAWEKAYERPKPVVIRVQPSPKPATSSASTSATTPSSHKATSSAKTATVSSTGTANSAQGSATSRPKAWYEF